jgi:hypothetical protein
MEDAENLLKSPEQYEAERQQNHLKKRQEAHVDDFDRLGVSSVDKMLFFLLKWVFNAIKIESDKSDEKLKGMDYVQKIDLIKQLQKNKDLIVTLNFKNFKDVKDQVRQASCKKEQCLSWDEFCDFFFLKDKGTTERMNASEHFWRKINAPDEEDPNSAEKNKENKFETAKELRFD